MAKWVVIGGQYEKAYYGTYDSLLSAKRAATKNAEYWDNFQGWRVPVIYRYEDTEERETKGMITYRDGITVRFPLPFSSPTWVKINGKWVELER